MKILLAGESWMVHMIHVKGFDSFTSSKYEEGGQCLIDALSKVGDVTYIPNHTAHHSFPSTIEEISQYDVVILSDIGANTLLLHDDTFYQSKPRSNRLALIRDYVAAGGGFLMVGGYLSFSGIEGKARYQGTPVEEILPVNVLQFDDRVEMPQGEQPTPTEHRFLAGISIEWPILLGYNRLVAKADADVAVMINGDPLLAFGTYGNGRTAVFASDCAPHWAPPEFLEWDGYQTMWANVMRYLTKEEW